MDRDTGTREEGANSTTHRDAPQTHAGSPRAGLTVPGCKTAHRSGGHSSAAAVAVAASIDCQADMSVSRRRRRAPAHADHPQPATVGGNSGPRRETAVSAGAAAAGSSRGGPSALLPTANTGITAPPIAASRPLPEASRRMQQQRRGEEARAAQRLLAASRADSARRCRVGGAVARSLAVGAAWPTAAAGTRRTTVPRLRRVPACRVVSCQPLVTDLQQCRTACCCQPPGSVRR